MQQGKLDDAETHVQQGITAAQKLVQPWRTAKGLRLKGALAYARHDIPSARVALDSVIHDLTDAHVLFKRNSLLRLLRAWAYDLLSQIEREQGNDAASRVMVAEVLKAGHELLRDSLLLMGLLQVAHHVAPPQAVELASLVQAHRHSYGFSREQAAQLLETLKGDLPTEAFAAAVDHGKSLDLAQTVEEALAWLAREHQ